MDILLLAKNLKITKTQFPQINSTKASAMSISCINQSDLMKSIKNNPIFCENKSNFRKLSSAEHQINPFIVFV
jgi:hypothetical protein